MALNAYLVITGQNQGQIVGSVTQKRPGEYDFPLRFLAVDHFLNRPFNSASGQATGNLIHRPMRISKEVDKASVPLYTALVNNENLPVPMGVEIPEAAPRHRGEALRVSRCSISPSNSTMRASSASTWSNQIRKNP